MVKFLKLDEAQIKWSKINKDKPEYISEEELNDLEEIRLNGEFIDHDDALKELGIDE